MSELLSNALSLLNEYKLPVAVTAGLVVGGGGVLLYKTVRGQSRGSENSKWAVDPIKDYCITHTNIVESDPLTALRKVTSKHARSVMESTHDVGQLLVFLMRTLNAKTVVEVGSFTGVALLKMAEELPVDGTAYALDISDEFVNIGKPFLKQAGVLDKVHYKIGPAADSLVDMKSTLLEKVDLCFIDADKPNYPSYYKLCMELVRPGGIIVFDNSLFGRKVPYKFNEEPYMYIHEANEKGMVDSRVTSMLLNIGDGCLVLRKNIN